MGDGWRCLLVQVGAERWDPGEKAWMSKFQERGGNHVRLVSQCTTWGCFYSAPSPLAPVGGRLISWPTRVMQAASRLGMVPVKEGYCAEFWCGAIGEGRLSCWVLVRCCRWRKAATLSFGVVLPVKEGCRVKFWCGAIGEERRRAKFRVSFRRWRSSLGWRQNRIMSVLRRCI